jgi:hypothetical protein
VALITFGDQLLVSLSSSLRPVIRQHLEARLASVFPSPLVRLLTALWCARVCCADPASWPLYSCAFRSASRWRGSTLTLVMRAATTLPVRERGCVHEASLLHIHTLSRSAEPNPRGAARADGVDRQRRRNVSSRSVRSFRSVAACGMQLGPHMGMHLVLRPRNAC